MVEFRVFGIFLRESQIQEIELEIVKSGRDMRNLSIFLRFRLRLPLEENKVGITTFFEIFQTMPMKA